MVSNLNWDLNVQSDTKNSFGYQNQFWSKKQSDPKIQFISKIFNRIQKSNSDQKLKLDSNVEKWSKILSDPKIISDPKFGSKHLKFERKMIS